MYSVFKTYVQELKLSMDKFKTFLVKLASYYTYRQNPYHNFTHACSVLHATNYILNELQTFSLLEQFAILLSAVGHDIDHTGYSNSYELATNSDLAAKYHGKSILENHHKDILLDLLHDS